MIEDIQDLGAEPSASTKSAVRQMCFCGGELGSTGI